MVARLGGDEFALSFQVLDDSEVIYRVECLQMALRRPFSLAGVDVDLDASIGVATPDAPELGAIDLMRRADVAMYAAKEAHESVAFDSPSSTTTARSGWPWRVDSVEASNRENSYCTINRRSTWSQVRLWVSKHLRAGNPRGADGAARRLYRTCRAL